MKLKIFLVALTSALIVAGASYKLFVSYAQTRMVDALHERVSVASDLFSYYIRSDAVKKIRTDEEFAHKPQLVKAFDAELWAKNQPRPSDTPEVAKEKKEVRTKIYNDTQVELNTINKVYDDSDILFITDINGNVVVKNLDGIFDGVSLGNFVLIKTALKGQADVDILKIKGINYVVTAVPFKNEKGEIVGTYCSGNIIDSEIVKDYASQLQLGSQAVQESAPIFFAMIENNKLLGSNMNPDYHDALRSALTRYSNDINQIKNEGEKTPFTITLNRKSFYVVASKCEQLEDKENVILLTLSSVDDVLVPINERVQTFLLIFVLVLVFAFIAAFIIDESIQKPITRFTEGMIEIINGNTSFRFNNDVTGLEEMLNQNANMMISVLLNEGKKQQKK